MQKSDYKVQRVRLRQPEEHTIGTVMIDSKIPTMIGTKIPTLDKVAPWHEDGLVNPTQTRGAATRVASGDTFHDQRVVPQRDIDQ